MSLRVIFLGTSASIPTPKRSLPAIAVKRREELFLFDCGEGTQRQMIQAKIGFHRKTKVFITHLHGDHVFGLPGLLQTMSLLGRRRELKIYGPPGINAFVEAIKQPIKFKLTFPIEIFQIKNDGEVCRNCDYTVRGVWAAHSIKSLSYAFIERARPGKFYPDKALSFGVPMGPLWSILQKGSLVTLSDGRSVKPQDVMGPPRLGRKVVYSGDTSFSEDLISLAENADLLIHEATFEDLLEERAREDGHSTPSQAAEVAKKAKVKKLVLTHISARYDDPKILCEQAKKVFPSVCVAEDFMEINV